jgi:deoxyribodipyrimidine photolyase
VLEEFVMQRMPHFSANRAKTDVRSTSRLSPHLHHGEISTRHNYYVVSLSHKA